MALADGTLEEGRQEPGHAESSSPPERQPADGKVPTEADDLTQHAGPVDLLVRSVDTCHDVVGSEATLLKRELRRHGDRVACVRVREERSITDHEDIGGVAQSQGRVDGHSPLL